MIGYDDIELAGYTFPPLTTVRQPTAQIGAAAANAIFDRLDNDVPVPNAVPLKPELIVRACEAGGAALKLVKTVVKMVGKRVSQ